MDKMALKFEVEHGALLGVPIYNTHKNAINWMAIIYPDPTKPNGIERVFQKRAYGDYYYMIDGLAVGQAVEFGADYYTYGGRRQPLRWYGVVLSISNSEAVFVKCESPRAAFEEAKKYNSQ